MITSDVHSFYQTRARHTRLRQALKRMVTAARPSDGIPEPCRQLLMAAPRVGKAELGALILAACRWSELATIDWSHLVQHRSAIVSQPKTESTKRITVPHRVGREILEHVRTPVQLPLHSRKRVQSCIEKAFHDSPIAPPRGVKRGTHAVRHLTASALHWSGWEREEIADRLGHHDPDSTTAYIHTKEDWWSS